MSSVTISRPSRPEKGSFFKLIDSFAWEIGTLKKEMGKKEEAAEDGLKSDTLLGLGEEVGDLFVQASPCTGIGSGVAGVRDSGYDSIHRRLSVLDRLVHTHSVWLVLTLSHQEATHILQNQPTGSFVVRKSVSLQRKVISLRMDKDSVPAIKDFPVKESQYTFSLEGSGLSFADLFRLVAFCCISRDVLPFTLKLPEIIASARTSTQLQEVAKLGSGFWDTQFCLEKKPPVLCSGKASPIRPPSITKRPVCRATALGWPPFQTRTPSELECCQSNGALCFINPLFLKVHQPHGDQSLSVNPIGNSLETDTKETLQPCNTSSQTWSCGHSDGGLSDKKTLNKLVQNTELQECETQPDTCQNLRASQSPPPRPPPPRFGTRRSAPPTQECSMPEKISWINVSKESTGERERGSSLFSRLSSSLSISPSSSPPKRRTSSPISISRPFLALSSSLSSTRRSRVSPSSSQEEAQCHWALEEQTIQNALLRAKLCQKNAQQNALQDSSSRPQSAQVTVSKQTEMQRGAEEAGDECSGGGQRLSDISLSTDSSDSLDFSQCSAFFLPPLHDPSPPSEADLNTHLPLSLPLSHLPYSSMEEEEEEDDEDDEDPDYGVSLESDQDQDLTMVPPGHRTNRRASAGALILHKALQGKLRKMSGVFNSLRTPERRAINRIKELSRDKTKYFGCLVQDFLSYMGEGADIQAWQGQASGLELLQTLRQFITQSKSYLRQSSDMEPPIESLIPEDHIDRVLEKAMHKCVLKPLKHVVSKALKEFQVRSGAWKELNENLALAKARQPQEMGVVDTIPPDPVSIEKIKHKFHTLCEQYCPEKKVTLLLRVCKLIYTIMEDNSGRLYGADDFLPMLTYVLAQCDMPQLDNEILYMMELLDPSQLHGEGGYYLTSAYGAMSLIRNFQEEQAARALSSETRDTLYQWHRRRTAQRSAPSIDDFQNYLRVALQELDSGCTAKTLQVQPYATVEDVCQLCAHKFKVSEPEKYTLFLLIEGSSQQLAPDTHPQKIKAELLSRSQPPPFHFVFRRVSNNVPPSPPPNKATSPSLSVPSEPARPSVALRLSLSGSQLEV